MHGLVRSRFFSKERRFETLALSTEQILPSEAGGPYCDFDNPLDFAASVNHGVDGFEFSVLKGFGALGLTKVDSAGKFANAKDVDSVGYGLRTQRGKIGQFRVKVTRAKVGK